MSAPALAEIVSFKAEMKGSSEVPPTDSKGTGSVAATYDTASKTLTWKGSYSGLTDKPTISQLHSRAWLRLPMLGPLI
jgi:CHRD domain-containing protein